MMAALAGETRPETETGLAVAKGVSPREALSSAAVHVESDVVALRVARLADNLRVHTPIASTVARILGDQLDPRDAVEKLMRGPVGRE